MSLPPITRRAFAAALAAPALPKPGALPKSLVNRHDDAVDRLLKLQITDPSNPNCGGYPDEYGLFHAGSGAGIVDACLAAWALPESRHHKSATLQARMLLGAKFMLKRQHEDGTIDLYTTNFHSTPDLGFVVHGAGSAAALARAFGNKEVEAALEPFLRRAAEALVSGGIHTPNHRWVVCEAMSLINDVYPSAKLKNRIDQWLAEGIDIDADGQYNERSTTIYNPITDKALLVTGIRANHPELLDPVRRNLEAMLYLMHPGGEVVTEISTRQDQYNRAGMDRYWLPLRYLAIKDNNGRFAEVVRRIEERSASLSAYMLYPELQQPLPASAPLPEDFHRLLPELKVARIRRGDMSASVLLNGNSRFFTMRKGGCIVEAVRFASAFFGKGQFRADSYEKIEGGYRMTQKMEGPYYQPLNPPRRVEARDWAASRADRKHSNIQYLTQTVTVKERKGGFTVEISSDGTAAVPVTVEITLRSPIVVEGATALPKIEDAYLLKQGSAVVRSGKDAIRIGTGVADHTWVQIRGAEPRLPGTTIYLTSLTPFRKTIEFDVEG